MEYSISTDEVYEVFEGTPEEIAKLYKLMYGEKNNIIEEGTVEFKEGCGLQAEPLKPITVELNLNTSKVTEGLDKIEEKLDRIIEKYEKVLAYETISN